MAKKTDNDKWLQVGNFLLGVEKKKNENYVVLKTVVSNWKITWSDSTMMFAMMLNLMKRAAEDETGTVKEYLHSLVTMMFVTTSYLHDLVALSTKTEMPFCEGVARLLKEQTDYEESLKEKPTGDEDEKALKEVGEMQDIMDELEKLDAEA